MDLEDQWEIQNDRIINKSTQSKINFIGLHNNTHNLKSYEGTDVCWVEEAQAVTEKSWDDLGPTIRKPKSEIWVTYNPDDELDPTHVRYVTNPRENSWVRKTSWRDAEEAGWFSEELKKEMLQMKEENYKKYLHVWEGEANTNFEDAIIQPEWVEAAKDAHIKLNWDVLGERITSFDPADTGDDKATCSRHGFLVEHLEAWTNLELPDSIQKAYKNAHDHKSTQFIYDADGMGVALKIGIDKNDLEYGVKSAPFKGSLSGKSLDEADIPYPPVDYTKGIPERVISRKDTFRNNRALHYILLRDRFENTYNAITKGLWVNPDNCISLSSEIPEDTYKQLRRELTRVRRKKGGNTSLTTLESKSDMKAAGIKSPGLADSLMMSFANPPAFGTKINLNMQRIC
jgi:phage terminase large subunit